MTTTMGIGAAGSGGAGDPAAASGKTAADENFPVASLLIAPRLRPHIRAFYRFARAIDDIADSPVLDPSEKLARLALFERALVADEPADTDPPPAIELRESLRATGVSPKYALDLLAAFRQDVHQSRYADWDDLVGYCTLSANPVGRYLLDLHGESADAAKASDALCTVLQILNHLQDCGDDYRRLNRIYLPGDMMEEAGASVSDLAEAALTQPLRDVIDRLLDRCDLLIAEAAPIGRQLQSRRLAAEAAAIVVLARRLSRQLRRDDPLAIRVSLSKWDFAAAAGMGALSALLPRNRA